MADEPAGAENRATIAALTETCKFNAVGPLAYLATALTAILLAFDIRRLSG